jgi:AcrR family transcriptional regulator
MVRQARSEATRKRIMTSAVDLFAEVGYQATALGDIIDRAKMTKGAFYYHFDSKQALATAVIEEGAGAALAAFRHVGEPSAPALEHMIRGVFVVADLVRTDKMVRTGAQLIRAFGEFNDATVSTHGLLSAEMADKAIEAIVEGDIREDQDPAALGEVIVSAMLGAELVSNVSSGGSDLIDRIAQTWQLLLPALATDTSLPRYREFVARESQRHGPAR